MLADIYNRVTAKIIEDLEKGVRPWIKPWSAGNTAGKITQPLRHNGTPYRGINILLLWSAAAENAYTSPYWMTFKQAQSMNAHVRKGERGSLVVYADTLKVSDTDDDGKDILKEIHFLKGYTVFNADQIEGLKSPYADWPEEKPKDRMPLIEHAEMFFNGTNATIRHGGNKAFYSPANDLVQLPVPEAFKDVESYEATKGHELVHWTKHESRLARDFEAKRFGDSGYAREELVAEIGSAFLCAELGITPETRADHAAYLSHWITVLKEDNKAIITAASYAQKAVDYLKGLQPKREP